MGTGPPHTGNARRVVAAAVALSLGLALMVALQGFSTQPLLRLVQGLAVFAVGIAVVGVALASVGVRMADWRATEPEFDEQVQRAEALAEEDAEEEELWGVDPYDSDDFDALVRDALNDLTPEFRRALERVPVVISDDGRRRRAYGMYCGDGVARDDVPDQILIFRDTLLRDFGHDPDELRAQVTRTVRHELAHHLGFDELGVRGLGL